MDFPYVAKRCRESCHKQFCACFNLSFLLISSPLCNVQYIINVNSRNALTVFYSYNRRHENACFKDVRRRDTNSGTLAS